MLSAFTPLWSRSPDLFILPVYSSVPIKQQLPSPAPASHTSSLCFREVGHVRYLLGGIVEYLSFCDRLLPQHMCSEFAESSCWQHLLPFQGRVTLRCTCVTPSVRPSLRGWTPGPSPLLGCHGRCCCERGGQALLLLSFPWRVVPEVDSLGHTVILCLIF